MKSLFHLAGLMVLPLSALGNPHYTTDVQDAELSHADALSEVLLLHPPNV